MVFSEHLSMLHIVLCNNRAYNTYHVTVMPCYDKKLEAVRDDFTFSMDKKDIAEVDSVLTTGEVLDLIQVDTIFLYIWLFFSILNLSYGSTIKLGYYSCSRSLLISKP
jgi:iron only hydrogenase large subunit-like protein